MAAPDRQQHWETIYTTKGPDQLSWTQPVPATSLHLLASLGLSPQARIIDIGGGDSLLVDHLVAAGYRNVTVLDLSAAALARAQARLGERAQGGGRRADLPARAGSLRRVARPGRVPLLHDASRNCRLPGRCRAGRTTAGYLTLGTFSTTGPASCSGLPVQQYSEAMLVRQLRRGFTKLRCLREDHQTPFQTVQNFLFCAFRRTAQPAT